MAAFVILLLILFVGGLLRYMVREGSPPEPTGREPAPTEAELLQARLELLKIEKGVDLALFKNQVRREAEMAEQDIADALGRDKL